jgi:hypothetical protein
MSIDPKAFGPLLELPAWGVVSTFAVDTLYDGLTYQQAVERAKEEAKEPGRDAVVVLCVQRFEGPSLLRHKRAE